MQQEHSLGSACAFILVIAPGAMTDWKGRYNAEGQGLGLDYLKHVKEPPFFTYIFFFLKRRKCVSLLFKCRSFPTTDEDSCRWGVTLKYRRTSCRQGWDVCKQENNFDLCCSGEMPLSLLLEIQLFVKSEFLWVPVIFHFFIRHRTEMPLNHVSLDRNVSDEFVECQLNTKLCPLELL